MKRAIVTVFFSLIVTLATAAEVRLALDESSVLPGTPTGFTITVTNPEKHALQLPAGLWLVATNDEFETFRVSQYGASDGAAATVPEMERSIAVGGTREFRFDPSVVLVGSPWFTDGRLSRPGTYRLRAVFAPEVAPDGTYNAAHGLASKEVELKVETTSDDDAAVWRWMEERGRGSWGQNAWLSQAGEFAKFVMANHPQSSYALYAAIYLPRPEMMPILLEQTRRFPEKSFSDHAKFLLAHYHWEEFGMLSRSDARASADEADASRRLASEVATTTRSSLLRKSAQDLLAKTPTREQLLRSAKAK